MNKSDIDIKQCCENEPEWIFIYSKKYILGVCKKHFGDVMYKVGVKSIISVKTKKDYRPEELFPPKKLVVPKQN